jgi:inner membrane protein
MASAFSHAIAAIAIGKVSLIEKIDKKFWLLGMFCAVIPDADAIGFKLGIAYESVLGHRGFTHSFFFAALLAFVVTYFFYGEEKSGSRRWWKLFGFFFFATASHAVLDAMTTGGLGVAFFAPFNNTRYFFPFRPIKVSPIGVSQFFSSWGLAVLKSEFIWVWIPSFIVMAAAYSVKKLRTR